MSEKDEQRNRFYTSLLLCAKGGRDIQFAQGNRVEINAESKINKQRRTSKEVSLQVCGIHPYDLLDELGKKSKGDYYATLIWKNPPDSIQVDDLKKVADILDRAKFAEDIIKGERKPGVAGVEADPARSARAKATLYGYLPACTVVSLIIGGIRHLSFVGAITNAVIDCVLPAGWVLADQWEPAKGVKDFITDKFKWLIDLIPKPWRKNAAETAEALREGEAEVPTYKELVSAAFTSVGTRSVAYGVVQGELNPGNVKKVSRTVARNITNEIKHANVDSKAFKALGDPQVLKTIEGKLSDTLEGELSGVARQRVKGEALDSVLDAATKKSLQEVGTDPDVAEALFKSEKALSMGGADDVMKAAKTEVVEEILQQSDLGRVAAREAGEYTFTSATDATDFIERELKPRLKSKLKTRIENSVGEGYKVQKRSVIANKIDDAVDGMIRKPTPTARPVPAGGQTVIYTGNLTQTPPTTPRTDDLFVVKVDESYLRGLGDEAADSIKEPLKKAVKTNKILQKKASQKVVKTLGSQADEVIASGGKRLTGWRKFKAFMAHPFKLTFWKSLIKEGLHGAIANAAGLFFYNMVYKQYKGAEDPSALSVAGSEGTAVDTDGDAAPDAFINITTTDLKLNKYGTYHIRLDDTYVRKDLVFSAVDSIPEDAKKENIIEKCDDESFKEGVEAALPGLLPDPDEPPTGVDGVRHAKHVIAYIKKQNGYRYGALIASAAKDTEVPEELVVTVAIWKSDFGVAGVKDWITGCRQGDAATKKPQDSFKCAATSLNLILKQKCTEGSEEEIIICTLEEYNKDPNKVTDGMAERDYDGLYDVYEKWNGFAWPESS